MYVFLLKYVVLESGLIFPFSYGLKVPIWLSTTRIILSLLLGSNSSQSLMHATVKPLGPLTGSSCLLTWHSRKSRVRMAIIGTSQSAQQAAAIPNTQEDFFKYFQIRQCNSSKTNCQTHEAFDRFFMPFDVTYEKIHSKNCIHWNFSVSSASRRDSKHSRNIFKQYHPIC